MTLLAALAVLCGATDFPPSTAARAGGDEAEKNASLRPHDADKTRRRRRYRKSLIAIWKEHRGNLADKWASYLRVYSRLFAEYRRSKRRRTRLLEIGVLNGGSLSIWSQYFGPGRAQVVGVDIEPEVCLRLGAGSDADLGDDVALHCFDATDEAAVAAFLRSEKHFDIIIDDASHRNADIVRTFGLLFPHLAPGGSYSIEDLGNSYQNYDTTKRASTPTGGGGSVGMRGWHLPAQTAIGFFTKLVDFVNVFHVTTQNVMPKLTAEEVYICRWVESVQFHDGIILVRKRVVPRAAPMLRVLAGEKHLLTPLSDVTAARESGFFANTERLQEEEEDQEEDEGDEDEEGEVVGGACKLGDDSSSCAAAGAPLPHRVYINEKAHYHPPGYHLFFYFNSLEREGMRALRRRADRFCRANWLYFQSPACAEQLAAMAVKELGGDSGQVGGGAAAAGEGNDNDNDGGDDDEEEEEEDVGQGGGEEEDEEDEEDEEEEDVEE